MRRFGARKWKLFVIGSIFDVKTGANVSRTKLVPGNIPRITATSVSNGVDEFSEVIPDKNFRVYENCVSVSFLGDCFYQKWPASYDMKIHNLKFKHGKFNRYIGNFIAAACRREFKKFAYGDQLSSSDLPRQKILLPINKYGRPDYGFMEKCMREIERKLILRYKTHLNKLLKVTVSLEGGGSEISR